jgi:hypothetical protein
MRKVHSGFLSSWQSFMLLGGLAPAALGGLAFDKLAGEKLIKAFGASRLWFCGSMMMQGPVL